MSGLLQVENQYWKCWFTGTKMSLVKYCLIKDGITSENDLCLWLLRELFSWISTNGDYFYTYIYFVAWWLYLSAYHCSTIQTEILPGSRPTKDFVIIPIYYSYHATDIFYSLQQVECYTKSMTLVWLPYTLKFSGDKQEEIYRVMKVMPKR